MPHERAVKFEFSHSTKSEDPFYYQFGTLGYHHDIVPIQLAEFSLRVICTTCRPKILGHGLPLAAGISHFYKDRQVHATSRPHTSQ